MIIRPALATDIFAIEQCLVAGRSEMDFTIPEHATPLIYHNFLEQVSAGLLFVAEADNAIVGCVALAIHRWPWNREDSFLTNEHFYVAPSHRKGGTAAKLLRLAKDKAVEMALPLIVNLVGAGDRPAKDRFMQTQGFKYLGGKFLYEGG